MSPVGPYPDFDACVADNQDKDDPEAFCAFLEGETEAQHTDEEIANFEKAAKEKGFVQKNARWHRFENKMKTHTVTDVEIFATGVHNGDPYLEEDLDGMIKAFTELKGLVDPPLKIGHTSDEFNQALAEELGVPAAMLAGDESGQGAMALGWLSNMRREGKILLGDFVDVPEPVADLIKSKAYQKISVEILYMFDVKGEVYKFVITGVALLGAELPAVLEIAGVADATVFTYAKKPSRTLVFSVGGSDEISFEDLQPTIEAAKEAMEKAIKGKVGAPLVRAFLKEITAKLKNMLSKKHALETESSKKEEVDMKGVLELLSLKDDATEEEAITAIKALQEKIDTNGKIELKEMAEALGITNEADKAAIMEAVKTLMEKVEGTAPESKEFANLTQKVSKLENDLAGEKRKGRIAHFTDKANDWGAISGKPEEIAERIVNLEEKDEEAAEEMVKTYNETNSQLIAVGILKGKGTPEEGLGEGESEFEKEVKTYAQEHHVDEQAAFTKVKEDRPDLFRKFMRDRPRVYAKSPEPES